MDVNYGTGEVSLKIVYYGPGLSGKTTNLEVIHSKAPESNRGRLTAIATQQDRTLFFDFMPLDLGKIGGLKTKLRLFTVPGQVFYNATRKLVLQRVDGVVFIADSQAHKLDENIESLENLEENLKEYGVNIKDIPIVFQYNKRDMKNVLSMEELNESLNSVLHVPFFPAVACTGEGVFPTLKSIAGLVLKAVENMSKGSPGKSTKVENAAISSLKKKFVPKGLEPPKKAEHPPLAPPSAEVTSKESIQKRKGTGLLESAFMKVANISENSSQTDQEGSEGQLSSKLKKIVQAQEQKNQE